MPVAVCHGEICRRTAHNVWCTVCLVTSVSSGDDLSSSVTVTNQLVNSLAPTSYADIPLQLVASAQVSLSSLSPSVTTFFYALQETMALFPGHRSIQLHHPILKKRNSEHEYTLGEKLTVQKSVTLETVTDEESGAYCDY